MDSIQKKENLAENLATFLIITIVLSALTYIPLVFPFSIARLVLYGLVALMVSMRIKGSGQKLPLYLVIAAAAVDVLPVLSLIPFVPTALNVAGIVLAAQVKKQ